MKRVLAVILALLLLSGCTQNDNRQKTVTGLRESLLQMQYCTFHAVIRADYGDDGYEFSAGCRFDREGNLEFSVTKPETIVGISGSVRAQGGALTFDDTVLGFPLLADGEVSPVSAPWILMRTLVGGYISSWATEGEYLHVVMDDSYEADALQVDVWLDVDGMPSYGELVWQGRKVLSVTVEDFEIV